MAIHRLLPYLSFVTTLFSGTIAPYVHQVDHWANGSQDLYCLHDYHDAVPYAITQRNDLIELANDSNSLLIVEDMAGYEGMHEGLVSYVMPYSVDQPSEQFLLHITTQAKLKHIPVRNVEFRQPTVGGVEDASISAKDALDLVEAVEQEARTYNDGEPFNTYYRSVLTVWDKTVGIPIKKWFSPIRKSDQPLYKAVTTLPYDVHVGEVLAPYKVGHLPETAQKTLVFKLYNSAFLDVRIVHELAQAQKYKTIYICAGSGHINRINSFLAQAGYTYKNSFEDDEKLFKGVDLKEAYALLSSPQAHKCEVVETHKTSQTFPMWIALTLIILGLIIGYLFWNFKYSKTLFARVFLPLIVMATIANTAMPYVTEIQVWTKGNQTISCLSDGHYPTPLSEDQTNQFIERVLQEKDSSRVIIEDILAYDGPNKEVTRALDSFEQPELHFLPHLTKNCTKTGLSACSIEFRQHHFASRCGAHVTGKQVYEVADQIRTEMSDYNDGSAFNRCYKNYQQELETLNDQCGSFVDQFRTSDQILVDALPASIYVKNMDEIITQYMGHSNASPEYKKEKLLKIYDAPLIDVRILHELAQYPQKKQIFICAGGWHIDNLATSFEELGYTKVWSTKGTKAIAGKPEFPKSVEVGDAFNRFDKYLTISGPLEITGKNPFNYSLVLILFLLACFPLVIFSRKRWLYVILLISGASTTFPYVYYASDWKNGDQTIHLYSDEHYPHPISQKQQNYLINRAQQSDSVVIVEDMKTYEGSNKEIHRALATYHDWPHHFLMNLTNECRDRNIPVVNVEFRQASNASLSGYHISAQEILQFSDALKEEISTYNDGPVYNQWYKQALKELVYFQNQYEPFFKQLRDKKQTFYTLLPKTRYYRSLDKALQESMEYVDASVSIKKNDLITMYDAVLIDLLILHALAQHPQAKDVYICAGGWHIANLEQAFDTFGYQQIAFQDGSIGITDHQERLPQAIDFSPHYITQNSDAKTKNTPLFGYAFLLLLMVFFIGILLRRYKFVFVSLLLFSSVGTQAHIYTIEKWSNQDNHNLFTLEDFHTSRLPSNHQGNTQRDAIVKIGKERRAQLIVEDIYPDAPALFNDPIKYDPNAIGPMEDKTPFKDSTTPLLALTPACKEQGVQFDNIEFRQVEYVSDMGHIITPADCVTSVDHIAAKIKTYDDTQVLNEYYAQQLKKYNTMRSQAQSFFDYLATITNKTTKELFEEGTAPYSLGIDTALATFGWTDQRIALTTKTDKMIALLRYYSVPLVDAQLAHSIYMHKQNPNLIICAGFKHIEAIQEILPALGYTKTGTEGKDLLEDGLPEPPALDIIASFALLDPNPTIPTNYTSTGVLIVSLVLLCFGFTLQFARKKEWVN